MRTTARETLIKVNTGNSFQYDFLDGVEWVYCLSNVLQKKKKDFLMQSQARSQPLRFGSR